jgi:hypothetical protein
MRHFYVCTTQVERPYIVAELAGFMVTETEHNIGPTYDEDAMRLLFPDALDAWQARDDSVLEEDEDRSLIQNATDALEDERLLALPLDEFLETVATKKGVDLDDEIVGRDFMIAWWTVGQRKGQDNE